MEVLVSINSLEEAEMVLSAGVKWIDLKDTSHGALASLPKEVSTQIIDYIHHVKQINRLEVTISATVGDVFRNVDHFISQIEEKYALGVDIIKIPYQALTLFQNIEDLNRLFKKTIKQAKVIMVFPPDVYMTLKQDLLDCLSRLTAVDIYGVMLDTVDKSKSIIDVLRNEDIEYFLQTAQKKDFFVGLAGGLQVQNVERLGKLFPNVIGFRSGISLEKNRIKTICPKSLQILMENCGKNTNLHNFFVIN